MNKIQREKIEALNGINDILLKERSYINVIKGFCENERGNSEQIADIYEFISDISSLHETLITNIDEAVIDFVSIFDRK